MVAFHEIFNEPVWANFSWDPESLPSAESWSQWKDFAEEVIDIIRANDPNTPIIVGGLQWSYDLSFAASNPVDRPNIVYGVHPYPSSNWAKSWEEAFGSLKESHPVFATEFGFCTDDPQSHYYEGNYEGSQPYREAIISFLEARGISWAVWCFSVSWTPTLLKDLDYTPTEAGEFFRNMLTEYASHPSSLAPPLDGTASRGNGLTSSMD